MRNLKQYRQMCALFILFIICLITPREGNVNAASLPILDQQQTVSSGNIWVSGDYPRYQTFTPDITGNLSNIDIYISGKSGQGAIQVIIYKDDNLSTPLGTAQVESFSSGWVSIDFSNKLLYLTRGTMYRMVVSSDQNNPSGFAWDTESNNPYDRGYSVSPQLDFTFKTYMVPDYLTSPTESQVSIANSSLLANGTSQTTVTVKLKDAQGNNVTIGGETVTISSTLGTVSAVRDNNNGTYTATLTAPTTVGTGTISASVGGNAIVSSTGVHFVSGPPSMVNSTIVADQGSLFADGLSQSIITVKLKDEFYNEINTGGETVTISSTLGTVSAVTDNNNGTYTATLTAPTTVGTGTISAGVGGNEIVSLTNIQFLPKLAQTVNASVASLTPIAGTNNVITLTVKNAIGATDTTYNGIKSVTISGYSQAPNGTFGSFNAQALTALTEVVYVNFTNGVATASLNLNTATEQSIQFMAQGVSTETANLLTITPVAGSTAIMRVTTDILPPSINGSAFDQQPILTLYDAYGNVSVNDNTTEVTITKNDTGAWTLTGILTSIANSGIVSFSNLNANNLVNVSGAQLAFDAVGLVQLTSTAVTLKAKRYNVSFDTNGASSVVDLLVVYGEKVTIPNIPIKTGYTFTGWYKEAIRLTEWNFSTDVVTADTTLYAKWNKNSYKVIFDTDSGATLAMETVPFNEKATVPNIPTKTGYTFVGWYKEATKLTEWNFSTDVVTADTTLYAKWNVNNLSGGYQSQNPSPTNPTIPESTITTPPEPQEIDNNEPKNEVYEFPDIESSHWAWEMIQEMARKGVITGYEDGSFRPNEPISRQHVAVMLARALELEPIRDSFNFKDISIKHSYYDAILKVQQAGLFDGNLGYFNPETLMTRAQMAKVIVLAFNLTPSGSHSFNDVSKTHWANQYIAILVANEVVFGYNSSYNPEGPVTRAQFVAFLYRALNISSK